VLFPAWLASVRPGNGQGNLCARIRKMGSHFRRIPGVAWGVTSTGQARIAVYSYLSRILLSPARERLIVLWTRGQILKYGLTRHQPLKQAGLQMFNGSQPEATRSFAKERTFAVRSDGSKCSICSETSA